MTNDAIKLSSDDNESLTRLITLICCVVVISGIACGSAAAQSGQSEADDDITTVETQNYSITISVTDSTGSTDSATTPITIPNTSDGTNSTDSKTGLATFDQDGNGQIDRDEAVQTVIAYNTGGSLAGQSVSRGTAVQAIIAYNTGQSV
jgi:hypothetical protein